MNKDKSKLTIAYTGEAVDDGTMDVSVLGPALMALGTLVNEANKIINNATIFNINFPIFLHPFY